MTKHAIKQEFLNRCSWILIGVLAFVLPFSLNTTFANGKLGLSIPSEPLMALGCILFGIGCILQKDYLRKAFNHPVSWVLGLYLLWVLVSALCSELPVVALKSWIVKVWFILTGYFLTLMVLTDLKRIERVLWLLVVAMSLVSFYGLIKLYIVGYSYETAFYMTAPFFKEHTNYSAVTAFLLPIAAYFAIHKSANKLQRYVAIAMTVVLLGGVIFSVCRAAWISVVVMMGVFGLIYFKIKIRWLVSGIVVAMALLFVFQKPIVTVLERNTTDKSDNFSDLIVSSFNYRSSESNLERLNRWQCGLRMAAERPILGHGAGTYQFLYTAYQKPEEMVPNVSTMNGNSNVHQEYLMPLVDAGIPAFILFLVLVFYIFRLTYHNCRTQTVVPSKLSIALFLGFVTFFVHGFFNSFLELDKSAIPFFTFVAMLVSVQRLNKGLSVECGCQ
ncbi:hypothetical protein FACS1894201_00520 [Bacteroidia bacterium]|nr:hypothetical protein FACS1894201_00520 [Bacteroidia bacterium]